MMGMPYGRRRRLTHGGTVHLLCLLSARLGDRY